ncbi:hypothetical protein GE061_000802 [Apolygus lucorum]|uniref:Uncharacterized protein n=1 Tax=Apolygus lucorum TaxID=248454 RepID=A0A8S9Y5B1_APOLU|nr:hypothetical protein GE061_000802 [Apolygus lucorum]
MPVIEENPLNEQDIDLLASDMKENLRLSSYCVKRTVTRHLYSPYRREDRKGPMDLSVRILRKPSDNNKSKSDDPYDMLQELLNKGCLIQEAVKRLQLGVPKLIFVKRTFRDSR